MANISPKPNSVSTIIRSFKSAVTRTVGLSPLIIKFGWQSRFHDHIIRNYDEYVHISEYIKNNPANWKTDRFFG